jgi:hypothetical protein
MPACTFISKTLLIAALLFSFVGTDAFAQAPGATAPAGAAPKKDDPGLFDQSTPYLDYGDFNINDDDDADTMYFQYGRFFGLSLGLGYETATGNRGLLYTPAFPRFDLKVHYWFDFQLAMNIGIFFASHQYDFSSSIHSVKLIGYGVDLKYYFDVKNSSAALTFSNPFIIAGVGSISKTETSSASTNPDLDSTFSVNFGAGLEFPIVYKKTYFILEGRFHTQSFLDTNEVKFQSKGISDLSGGFFTLMGHILFTW